MNPLDNHLDKYGSIIEQVVKQANQRMQTLLANYTVVNGRLVLSEENVAYTMDLIDRLYSTLNEAGYGRFADKYRNDFMNIYKEFNAAKTQTFTFNFLPKDKAVLQAISTANYEGLFRVEREVANTIQRLATDYVLTERPIADLANELREQLEGRLQRYAKTHVETSTRQAIQKGQDLVLDNEGIEPKDRYYEYVGPLDGITREECVEAVTQRYFTEEERLDFESEYGVRYNCRHVFQYIPKAVYYKVGKK